MTDSNTKDISQITDLSEMIEKLKESPEIVSSVITALGLGAPPSAETSADSDSRSKIQGLISSLPESNSAVNDNRIALLVALKPYLSRERGEIIDYIIKFSKLGDMLKKLK
jgi:hypothetical protein